MITLRSIAVAFLRNNGNFLLMKRADTRTIAPGIWSGIGGHLEKNEINSPLAACYREIEEETGITTDKIDTLEMLYVVTRRSKDEIRHIYVYFGETTETGVIQTREGVLYWIPYGELMNREYTKPFAAMLEHYTKRTKDDNTIYLGVADIKNGVFQMSWSRCVDFEQMTN